MQSTLKSESKSIVAWDGKGQKRGITKVQYINVSNQHLYTPDLYFKFDNVICQLYSGKERKKRTGACPCTEKDSGRSLMKTLNSSIPITTCHLQKALQNWG